MEHLDILLKLKDERVEELQKQLERKQSRRKEVETLQNTLSVPFDVSLPTTPDDEPALVPVKVASTKLLEVSKIPRLEESKVPLPKIEPVKTASRTIDIKKEEIVEQSTSKNDDEKFDDGKKEEIELKDYQDADEFKDSEAEVITDVVTPNKETINGIAPTEIFPAYSAM